MKKKRKRERIKKRKAYRRNINEEYLGGDNGKRKNKWMNQWKRKKEKWCIKIK